jgi:hypothetical protein
VGASFKTVAGSMAVTRMVLSTGVRLTVGVASSSTAAAVQVGVGLRGTVGVAIVVAGGTVAVSTREVDVTVPERVPTAVALLGADGVGTRLAAFTGVTGLATTPVGSVVQRSRSAERPAPRG